MKLNTFTKILLVFASLVLIGLLAFVSVKMMEVTGMKGQRIETIKEYSVKYDQIPPLNQETAEKIKKANQDYRRTSMYLGLLLIAIMGTTYVFVKLTKKKEE